MLEITPFILGPVYTNAYLIADSESNQAAVIDPAWDGHLLIDEAIKCGWQIGQLWYTHAHFDHIGGAAAIANALEPAPQVAMHPADHELWKVQGGAALFGFRIDSGPAPTIKLAHGQILRLGNITFEVRHTPGHTPGHCVFYDRKEGILFSGDLIFQGGVGRADLPNGNWDSLIKSIREQIFSLPNETRLLSGHGRETTVGEEKAYNPFVNG